jgi:hypothetical protein
MVFLVGTGGERESARVSSVGSVFAGRRAPLNNPIFLCYILYIANGVPNPWFPGQTRVMLKFRHPDHLFHTLKTVKGLLHRLGTSSNIVSVRIYRSAYERFTPNPIDSGMGLSITIDKLRVFINKTSSTQSLINKLLIKRVDLSISIDSR